MDQPIQRERERADRCVRDGAGRGGFIVVVPLLEQYWFPVFHVGESRGSLQSRRVIVAKASNPWWSIKMVVWMVVIYCNG